MTIMIKGLRRLKVLSSALTLVMLSACSSSSKDATDDESSLELYSWWTNPGETEALSALLDAYSAKYPNTSIINATVEDADNARTQLVNRMSNGSPPDTFQALGGGDLLQWVADANGDDSQSKLEPLDDIVAELDLRGNVPEAVMNDVSFGGKVYGIPIGVHRLNILYYNTKILAQYDLTPPTTLEDFYATAEVLQSNGITPIAIGSKQSWTISQLVLDAALVASAGPEFRESYLAGQEDPNDPRIVETLKQASKMLTYTNQDRDAREWGEAAQMFVTGEAAMLITGDIAKGYFLSQGMVPGVDFAQAPAPGAKGVFVYIMDSFNLPRGATNHEPAVNFLRMLGTPEVQNVFNPIKGSSPTRTDADLSAYDALATETINDLRSDYLTPSSITAVPNNDFRTQFDKAMGQFSADGDSETVLRMLKNYYDLLQK